MGCVGISVRNKFYQEKECLQEEPLTLVTPQLISGSGNISNLLFRRTARTIVQAPKHCNLRPDRSCGFFLVVFPATLSGLGALL